MPVQRKRFGKLLQSISVHSRNASRLLTVVFWAGLAAAWASPGQPDEGSVRNSVRIATFNVSMNRPRLHQLRDDLRENDAQIQKVARIIRTQRPDILLLNEFDYDESGESLRRFQQQYLQAVQKFDGLPAITYEYSFIAQVNTGQPTGLDLNRDGKVHGPADCHGYGEFPGQYGMVVLSKFPIQKDDVRTFQKLKWSDLPGALKPVNPDGTSWYSRDVWRQLRLSSKSHWDVPISVGSRTVHLLASHPTPPAFDGPEDRNGCRNHDEIRFWKDYVAATDSDWIVDDRGAIGGLATTDSFVIAGDLNSDPQDGGSRENAIFQLLNHDRVNSGVIPSSQGGTEAAVQQGQANDRQTGKPEFDTADFSDRSVGNLRVDYVLPSSDLKVISSGVFWPTTGQPGRDWLDCSDHRMVWVDVQVDP